MAKLKRNILGKSHWIVLFPALLLCLFLILIPSFESNSTVLASRPEKFNDLSSRQTQHLFQRFKASVGFNSLKIYVTSPLNRELPCRFLLRNNSQDILFEKTLLLKKAGDELSFEEISFPMITPGSQKSFTFEIIQRNIPFRFLMTGDGFERTSFQTRADGENVEGALVFSVEENLRLSFFSYFSSRPITWKKLVTLLLLILSSASLMFTAYLLSRIHKTRNVAKNSLKYSVQRKHLLIILGLALFLFAFVCFAFIAGANTYSQMWGANDDAFITYKYAKNISSGMGFSFNQGEKCLGTTTPFYALLLSFFALFTNHIPLVSVILNLTSILLSSIVLYFLLSRHLSPSSALLGAVLFLYFPFNYRALGMETNIWVFLVLLSLFFFLKEKIVLSSVVLGLAVLTRTETILIASVLFLLLLVKKKFSLFGKAASVFAAVLLPWYLFSLLYFGNIFQNTFYSKTMVGNHGDLAGLLQSAFKYLFSLSLLKGVYFQGFGAFLAQNFQFYPVWAIFLLTALLFSWRFLRKDPFIKIYISWIILYVFSLSMLRASVYIWYYVLPLSIIPILIASGLDSVKSFLNKRKFFGTAAPSVAVISICLVVFAAVGVHRLLFTRWYEDNIFYMERYSTYKEMARFINDNIPAGKSIATEEIGILGYYSDHHIFDLYGLIHPHNRYPISFDGSQNERIAFLLTLMDPDYLMLNSMRSRSRVPFTNYEEIRMYPIKGLAPEKNFYYSILKKKDGRMAAVGEISLPDRPMSEEVKISGFCLGANKVERVEVLVGHRVVASTGDFLKSPLKFRNKYKSHINSPESFFQLELDSRELPNGRALLEFWAVSGSERGLFEKKTITVQNII